MTFFTFPPQNFINIMNNRYSLEAHLLHSGLQLIWKRLLATRQMDARQIWTRNKTHFEQVAEGIRKRFGITCTEAHMKEASEMLHHAYQLNIPKNHYVIIHSDSHANQVSVTMDEYGNIVRADEHTEWTADEAQEMLAAIRYRHPKISAWIEDRIPRYVRRVRLGD